MVNHLLAIDDVNEDFEQILKWAIEFKRLWKQGDEVALNFMPLDTMTIGSIYEKPSTRTRVSFEVGIHRLGGNALTLLKNDIQLGKSETVGDTSQVLSRFLGGMTYRCFAHDDVVELAKYATVPVLNALSAKHHPCQAAADLMTVMEHFTDRENLVVTWVGDGNNVLHDLMLACTMLGIDFDMPFQKAMSQQKMCRAVSEVRHEARLGTHPNSRSQRSCQRCTRRIHRRFHFNG